MPNDQVSRFNCLIDCKQDRGHANKNLLGGQITMTENVIVSVECRCLPQWGSGAPVPPEESAQA